MPDTPTHDKATLVAGVTVGLIGIVVKEPLLIPATIGCLSGLLISPDWDWDGWLVHGEEKTYIVSNRKVTYSESKIRRVYGKVIRRWPKVIQPWLRAYALTFSHRKGRVKGLSHTPILGTILRCCWLVFPLILLWFFPEVTIYWFSGLLLVDSFHLLLDFKF
jgi:uncharacterized metal-binding protein